MMELTAATHHHDINGMDGSCNYRMSAHLAFTEQRRCEGIGGVRSC